MSSFLKKVNPKIKCYLADPPGSALAGYVLNGCKREIPLVPSAGSSIAEGIGSNRITANFAEAQLDGAVQIDDVELVEMAYFLLRLVFMLLFILFIIFELSTI